jgi:hypothetical protein
MPCPRSLTLPLNHYYYYTHTLSLCVPLLSPSTFFFPQTFSNVFVYRSFLPLHPLPFSIHPHTLSRFLPPPITLSLSVPLLAPFISNAHALHEYSTSQSLSLSHSPPLPPPPSPHPHPPSLSPPLPPPLLPPTPFSLSPFSLSLASLSAAMQWRHKGRRRNDERGCSPLHHCRQLS